MGACHAVINELSFGRNPGNGTDADIIRRLQATLVALRSSVAIHDSGRIVFVAPPNLGALELAGGTRFASALAFLPFDTRQLVLALLDGPWVDGAIPTTWQFNGRDAPGLGEAAARNGIAISLDVRDWRIEEVTLSPAAAGGGPARAVVNAWRAVLTEPHRTAVARHVSVLPEYEDRGAHDPESPRYISGKSHIPLCASRILRQAVSEGSGETWWAKCEHGFFHRFAGTVRRGRTCVHWNGTTNPGATQMTRIEDVPSDVRKRLAELRPVRDCGCRQLGSR